jgi:malonyl-CoA O-methyltransferase
MQASKAGGSATQAPHIATGSAVRSPQRRQRGTSGAKRAMQAANTAWASQSRHTAHWPIGRSRAGLLPGRSSAGICIGSIYCPPMADDAPTRSVRPVQPEALVHIARRLGRAAEPPWLHGEVARRMAERLAVIRLQPRALIDWWSFNGAAQALLQQAYPQARVLRVEADEALLERGRSAVSSRWWSPRRWGGPDIAWVAPAAVAAGGAQLLWSNMMLHLCGDPLALMQQWQRALAVDGFLMFSTLGPGSLTGLRQTYARLGWPAPHAPFVDMHDLGDMLVHAGFADPVMDQQMLTLTWPDAAALLRELRTLGGNADPSRSAGLRTPRWCERLCTELQRLRGADGRLRLDFELVYGHALRAAPKPRVAARTTVALDEMRQMVRSPRRTAGRADGLR